MVSVEGLTEGDLCHFVYKQLSGNGRWYRWECIAIYVAGAGDEFTDSLIISYRPLAGTSYIETKGLLELKVLEKSADRLGRRGDPAVRLPTRKPGAVTAP